MYDVFYVTEVIPLNRLMRASISVLNNEEGHHHHEVDGEGLLNPQRREMAQIGDRSKSCEFPSQLIKENNGEMKNKMSDYHHQVIAKRNTTIL